MSFSIENTFDTFLQKWVDSNQWPPEGASSKFSSSILTLSAATKGGFHFHSGAGSLEVEGYYDFHDPDNLKLVDASIRFMVPSWGGVLLMSSKTISLSRATRFEINIGSIKGDVVIQVDNDLTNDVVTVQYNLSTPYGRSQDYIGLFPVQTTELMAQRQSQIESLEVLSDAQVVQWEAASLSPGSLVAEMWQLDDLGVKDQAPAYSLLQNFLQDFAIGGKDGRIVLPTYEFAPVPLEGGQGELNGLSSDGYTVDVSFFGVFGLQGTVKPADLFIQASLYVTIPLAGRTKLVAVSGSLKDGAGLTTGINAVVASGSATFRAKPGPNGKHVVYVDLLVKVKLLGEKRKDNIELFTLPF